jgi:hypothetical protein
VKVKSHEKIERHFIVGRGEKELRKKMLTLLWGGRKSIVCEKVRRLRPLVLLARVRVNVGRGINCLEISAIARTG